MPTIHQLYREQTIATDLNTAWDFIRSPQNLDRITPDDMAFEIVSKLPEAMYNGLLIEYRIGIPLVGKQAWLTELKHIREHHSFVDEQLIGPYKLWYHYHQITEVEGGVCFTDHVKYVMPFGPLGAIAHAIYVKNQLKTVFDFREKAMVEHLSSVKL
jgi:ligand-binding SRPBCC domain-containing protein